METITRIMRVMKMKSMTISKKMIAIRTLLIIFVMISSFFSTNFEKAWLSLFAFTIAFVVSVYAHKFFLPFITLALFFFLLATTTEIRTDSYQYTELSTMYWTIGNLFLAVGLLDFLYRLLFVYHVIDRKK